MSLRVPIQQREHPDIGLREILSYAKIEVAVIVRLVSIEILVPLRAGLFSSNHIE